MNYKKELAIAVKAAKAAGKYALKSQFRIKKIEEKGSFDYVSEVDRNCEKLIKKIIGKEFPSHSFLGEEYGACDGEDKKNIWIIDPIDGTNNYILGLSMFGVSIALEQNKEIVAGVVFIPAINEIYSAVKGKGAFLNGKKIKVSKRKADSALLTLGSRVFKEKKDYIKMINRIFPPLQKIRVFGSAVVNAVSVASGRCEAYIDWGLHAWDIAAACLIAKEAGAKLTTHKGKAWNHYEGNLILSNGIVHNTLLRGLK